MRGGARSASCAAAPSRASSTTSSPPTPISSSASAPPSGARHAVTECSRGGAPPASAWPVFAITAFPVTVQQAGGRKRPRSLDRAPTPPFSSHLSPYLSMHSAVSSVTVVPRDDCAVEQVLAPVEKEVRGPPAGAYRCTCMCVLCACPGGRFLLPVEGVRGGSF